MDAILNEDKMMLLQIKSNLESCILGKDAEIELLLAAVLAGGHVLLEDVPGTGKTVLIKALAKSVQGGGEQHTVTWTLQDLGDGKVNLHLEQSGISNAQALGGAKYGWSKWCGDLDKVIRRDGNVLYR